MRISGACFLGLLVAACGGSAVTTGYGDGGGLGGTQNTGGAIPLAGGLPGTGGAPGAGGSGGRIDCSMVGCAMPPLCATGCTEVCGCCPCGDGTVETRNGITYVCTGGCYAPSVDAGSGCTYLGRVYPSGSVFPSGDGCNTCTCSAGGQAACTEKACLCDPTKETHQREYVGTSPAQCATIRFTCAANTTMFHNACGCGCEQDPSCPEWFDCMPPTPCDEQQIHEKCPYSGIAY